jgi:NTP pyrophosphatase (non-canonical NTP hydrolase)
MKESFTEAFTVVYHHTTGTMLVDVEYQYVPQEEDVHSELGERDGVTEFFQMTNAKYLSGAQVPEDIFSNEVMNEIFDLMIEKQREKKMNPTEYVANALRTESVDMKPILERLADPTKVRLLHAALGLETEVGEIQDALKKHIFYGKTLDVVNLAEEMGDLFWYMAVLSDVLGAPFEAVMEKNIAKLRARYGEKFTSERALNRDLDTERKILES